MKSVKKDIFLLHLIITWNSVCTWLRIDCEDSIFIYFFQTIGYNLSLSTKMHVHEIFIMFKS